MKYLLLTSLLIFTSCDKLNPPKEGCCISWNGNNFGTGYLSIEDPMCVESMSFDDCKASNFDNNASYAAEEQSCTEASGLCY